jgi:hypothetical protein
MRLDGHLQAAARQAEATLGRLVAIGDAGHRDRLGLPAGTIEEVAEQIRGVLLDDDLRLEVQAGVEAEVFVRGASITERASILTKTPPI